MVEKAAHFSYTSQTKPSIFEVVAQNSLNITLHPALRKIAEFLLASSPKYFQWLDHYEEAFLAFNALLQYYYIRNYNASFSEYFYGLKRLSKDGTILTNKQKWTSLLFLVGFPYLKRKLAEKVAIYQLEDAERNLNKDFRGRFKKFLMFFHSSFEVCWGSWILINYLRYMADETESQTPSLHILKMKFVLCEENEDVTAFWSALIQGKMSFKEICAGLLTNGVRTSLEMGAFFIQFLQSWYAEKSNFNITSLPMVSPPQLDPKSNNYKGKCPICLQAWKIPTVIPASGYVFCFPCILRYVRENQRCPITNLPSQYLDLVRLFDS